MERNITTVTMVPDAQVDAYLAVDVTGTITAATGDVVYGIVKTRIQEAGESIEVVTEGECYATAGEAIALGSLLTGGADGKLMLARKTIDFVGSTFTIDDPFYIALEDAAIDEVFTVGRI